MRRPVPYSVAGITLAELLLVVALIGILLVLALPGYRQHVLETGRRAATAELRAVLAAQEQFFAQHHRYALQLNELGLPGASYAIDAQGNRVSAASRQRIYLIGSRDDGGSPLLYARPLLGQVSDSRCGTLSLTVTGRRLASGQGGVAMCW
ncbi:MAG: type IV pilin protein [Halioglobus sp.]|nr:type IV pilin protein [Halioglobus sp.]